MDGAPGSLSASPSCAVRRSAGDCIIGANSVVRGSIPDFSIAVGAPARVVGKVEGVDVRAQALDSPLWWR